MNRRVRVIITATIVAFVVSALGASQYGLLPVASARPQHKLVAAAKPPKSTTTTRAATTTTRAATTTTAGPTTTTAAPTTTAGPTTTTTPPTGCTGVSVLPTQDLGAVMAANPAGTTYCLQPGTHRVTTRSGLLPETGDTFQGVGQNAIVSGSKTLTGWTASGSDFVANGFLTSVAPTYGPCIAGKPLCNQPEDVWLDGNWLVPVQTRAELAAGKVFLDYPGNKVYVRDNPAGHELEQSWARRSFTGSAKNVSFKNFSVINTASEGNMGTIDPGSGGTGWLLDHMDMRHNHGYGTGPGTDGDYTIRFSRVHENGQDGLGGDGAGVVATDNEVFQNSYAGWDKVWDAGNKMGHTVNALVARNYVHDERGVGLWCDINCVNATYADNYVKNAAAGGIMFEISCGSSIHDNVVVNSGTDQADLANASIFISNSRGSEVYANKTFGGFRAIWAWEVDRPEATSTACPEHHVKNLNVHDNQMDLNSTPPAWGAKVGLWTDSGDNTWFTGQNNRFQGNTYYDTTPGSDDWNWHTVTGQTYADTNPWTVWQGYGQDTTGSVLGSVPTPPAPPVLVVGPQP